MFVLEIIFEAGRGRASHAGNAPMRTAMPSMADTRGREQEAGPWRLGERMEELVWDLDAEMDEILAVCSLEINTGKFEIFANFIQGLDRLT